MKRSTRLVRALVNAAGFELTRLQPLEYAPHANILGVNAFKDIKRLMPSDKPGVLFDIGANSGQSVRTFKNLFPDSFIHSFEPSPSVYAELAEAVKIYDNVSINNVGVGSASGQMTFLENSQSEMSSFLKPGKMGWGRVEKETLVSVTTVDEYCETNGISFINLLKIDTQGYEFEVLKGCQKLMRKDRIQMIYMEVNFAELYEGLPGFDELFRFLVDNNFGLVSFYEFAHQGCLASWSDALFLNRAFQHALQAEPVLDAAT